MKLLGVGFVAAVLVLITGAVALRAQAPPAASSAPDSENDTTALLNPPAVDELCVRVAQLMEAGGFAIPALARAAEPLIVNVEQSCSRLKRNPGAGTPTYDLLTNVRAYLNLADAVPKPFPFPDTARDQINEAREGANRLEAHFQSLLNNKDADLRSSDRDSAGFFQDQNRLLPAPDPGGRRVVFLGDSITAEWRINEYFPQEDFINRSIESQVTGQLLGRMKADVVNLQPKAVVVHGGSFDLTRNVPLTAIEDNYSAIADIASANGIRVIFTSVLPVHDYFAEQNPAYERTSLRSPLFIRSLNDWLKAYCAQTGCTYVDFEAALSDERGYLMQDASDDGLLPNGKGYRLMAPLIAEAIAEATKPEASAAKPRRR